VSARFGKPVPAGFIYQMTDDVVFRFGMCEPLLSEARAALSSLQSMIEKEIFPPATPIRARCTDCEYRNFCGDVF
jgi:CRISPR-associated exonuclease Cas4